MKRFLIFILVGPLVGFIVFILRDMAAGKVFGGVQGFLFGLPFAYLFGLFPALVLWLEDWWLEDKLSLWTKIGTSAVLGYVVSIAMLLTWTAVAIPTRQVLTFGIVGLVQAAVCSWLSGHEWRRRSAA